jgi:tRNA dimethylallyltransferase
LARREPGLELVSVDAMSVYVGLDIGTAKPTAAERAGLDWHLIDVVDPSVDFSVAIFQDLASRALNEIGARGHRAVLVGGTGLYHRALIDSLELPRRFPEERRGIEEDLARAIETGASEQEALDALHARLQLVDPQAAAKIGSSNRRRLVRALEVSLGAGRAFSSFGPGMASYPPRGFPIVGLSLSRQELDMRVADRFAAQLAAGMLEEVRSLLGRPLPLSRTARQALGYRELAAHLEDGVALEIACRTATQRIRRFARRQQAWFGRDPRVIWMDAARDDLVEAVRSLSSLNAPGSGPSSGVLEEGAEST